MSTTTVARYKTGNIATLAILIAGTVMAVKGAPLAGALILGGALLAMPSVRYTFNIGLPTIVGWAAVALGLLVLAAG